jgi:hypothetical protein
MEGRMVSAYADMYGYYVHCIPLRHDDELGGRTRGFSNNGGWNNGLAEAEDWFDAMVSKGCYRSVTLGIAGTDVVLEEWVMSSLERAICVA